MDEQKDGNKTEEEKIKINEKCFKIVNMHRDLPFQYYIIVVGVFSVVSFSIRLQTKRRDWIHFQNVIDKFSYLL